MTERRVRRKRGWSARAAANEIQLNITLFYAPWQLRHQEHLPHFAIAHRIRYVELLEREADKRGGGG